VYHDGCNLKITYPEDIASAEGILFGRGWQDVTEGDD
jgi:2-C-methyl-D-erythritol 4-phosphate cytidylyltransferase